MENVNVNIVISLIAIAGAAKIASNVAKRTAVVGAGRVKSAIQMIATEDANSALSVENVIVIGNVKLYGFISVMAGSSNSTFLFYSVLTSIICNIPYFFQNLAKTILSFSIFDSSFFFTFLPFIHLYSKAVHLFNFNYEEIKIAMQLVLK